MAHVTAYLFIESEAITAEDLSTKIGVRCDRSWKKGDPRGRTGKVYVTNGWKVMESASVSDQPDEIGRALGEALRTLLLRMRDHASAFASAATVGTSGLLIGVRAPAAPPIVIDADAILMLANLGVPVEIDLIVSEGS
jgi:hypothetical protein